MPARILIASADADRLKLIRDGFRRDSHQATAAESGADALRLAAAEPPDVLVVDSALPDIAGLDVIARLRKAAARGAQHLPIVLVGPADIEHQIAGLRAGADDYVAEPVNPSELAARVQALLIRFGIAAERPALPVPVRGRVHAFYGAKGGVGTTTIAINTAIALQRQTRRTVALVDANLQFGDHRVFLDLGPDKASIVDACSATSIEPDTVRGAMVRHESGVDLLLAPALPEAAEHVSAAEHQLQQVVQQLRSMYAYVIVDLDDRLDDHTLDVAAAADTFFVVLNADLASLKNVRLLLETLEQIGIGEQVELVLNRNKAQTGISVKSAESALGRPIRHQIVNDYRTAISSLNTGTPFMLDHPDSAIGRAVVEFAREISGEVAAPARPARPRLATVNG